jgi:predicted ester cyclase
MAQPLDQQFLRDFIRRLAEAINAHDPDAVAALCSENVSWMDPAAPEPLRGREAVRKFHRDGLFRAIPDVRFEVIEGPYLSPEGPKAAVRARFSGTMLGPLDPPGFAPTGQPIEFETAEFWEFEDGRLVRDVVVLNMLALARQIGAMPDAGSFGERMAMRLQHFSARRARRRAR